VFFSILFPFTPRERLSSFTQPCECEDALLAGGGLWYISPKRPFRDRDGDAALRVLSFAWEVLTVASVEERVIDIVCENLAVNKEQVNRNTSFQEDMGADSLDIVELVMELEEEFEITIPDDQAEKIKTVGEAIDYIEREQQKK
jgi:acyl carrier protein